MEKPKNKPKSSERDRHPQAGEIAAMVFLAGLVVAIFANGLSGNARYIGLVLALVVMFASVLMIRHTQGERR